MLSRFNPTAEPVEGSYFLNCVDPGGDTGMALLYIKPDDFDLIDYRTVPYDPHRSESMPTEVLVRWKLEYPGLHDLVYEDFHVRNTSAQKDTTALKVIGSMDQMIFEGRPYRSIFVQQPVGGKHSITDDVLRNLGLLFESHADRHMNDALRHAAAHLTKRRYRPLCLAAHPNSATLRSHSLPDRPRSSGSTPAR